MFVCFNCKKESESSSGWFAQLTEDGKVLRCHDCGKAEEERLWKYRYGDRPLRSTADVDKDERIQHAKDMREAGISPWSYSILNEN